MGYAEDLKEIEARERVRRGERDPKMLVKEHARAAAEDKIAPYRGRYIGPQIEPDVV